MDASGIFQGITKGGLEGVRSIQIVHLHPIFCYFSLSFRDFQGYFPKTPLGFKELKV
jgi:hypothetical protein